MLAGVQDYDEAVCKQSSEYFWNLLFKEAKVTLFAVYPTVLKTVILNSVSSAICFGLSVISDFFDSSP